MEAWVRDLKDGHQREKAYLLEKIAGLEVCVGTRDGDVPVVTSDPVEGGDRSASPESGGRRASLEERKEPPPGTEAKHSEHLASTDKDPPRAVRDPSIEAASSTPSTGLSPSAPPFRPPHIGTSPSVSADTRSGDVTMMETVTRLIQAQTEAMTGSGQSGLFASFTSVAIFFW